MDNKTIALICRKLTAQYQLSSYFHLNPCTKPHHMFFLQFIRQHPKNTRLLDACCGIGVLGVCLKKRGFCNYVGLDIAKKGIEAGKNLFKRFGVEGQLFCENIKKTHFQDSSFHIVCVLDASYFQSFNMEESVNEIYRILKSNGWLVMDVVETKHHPWHHNVHSRTMMKNFLKDFTQIEFLPLPQRPVKYVVIGRK